jgi:ABC-type dipeptide/oligopeptide/nickel transport system permease subunit
MTRQLGLTVQTTTVAAADTPPDATTPSGRGRALLRFARSSPVGAASAVFLLLVILMGVFAPWLAPYDPLAGNYALLRQPPTLEHPFGTDDLGRDVLSRIIYGARVTMLVSVTAVLLGNTLAFAWGISSGYLSGRFDLISQRVIEVLMAFPALILAMLLLVGLGAGLRTVILAIAVTQVPACTRIVRSNALAVGEFSYIEAARSIGAPARRIIAREVAPQCIAPFLVVLTLNLGAAVFAEAALSFLGVGVPPPTPSWGNMLGGVLASAFRPPWWIAVFPGIAITLTVMAANLVGDALRDFIDPKLRGHID